MCVITGMLNWIKCNMEFITMLLSIAALFAALYIPRLIMVNQMYTDLVREYRSTEMGASVLAVFYFFDHDCKNNVSNIHNEYINKYKEQIDGQPFESIDFSKTLHFQRRLLSQFYSDMAALRYEYRFPKRKLKNWFTPNEVKLLSILLYMAKPAKEVFIQANDVAEPPDDDIPMNRLIKRLYDEVEELA